MDLSFHTEATQRFQTPLRPAKSPLTFQPQERDQSKVRRHPQVGLRFGNLRRERVAHLSCFCDIRD